MILSDRDIVKELRSGRLVIDPVEDCQIQPASVDVRLDTELILSTADAVDLWWNYSMTDGPFDLKPGGFVLGSTVETVTVPDDLLCLVHGRSSTGRQGLIVETAGLVDPGWTRGQVTLEITNISARPVRLKPGMGIAQLTFQRLTSPAVRLYGATGLGSRYQGQRGPTLPRDTPPPDCH